MRRSITYILLALLIPAYLYGIQRPQVKTVVFKGNNSYSDRKLNGLMSTRKNGFFKHRYLYRDLLLYDLKNVLDFYYRHGFLDAQVEDLRIEWCDDSSRVNIVIELNEGLPVFVDSVEILGVDSLTAMDLKNIITIEAGDRLDFDKIEVSEKKALGYSGMKGHLAAAVSRNIFRSNQSAVIQIAFNIGPRYYLGEVEVTGNDKTKLCFFLRALRLDKGELITYDKIEAYKQKLFQKGIFESIHISFKPGEADTVWNLQVEVRERDAGELSLGGGYGSETGPRLSGDFHYINLYGRGAGIGLKTLISPIIRNMEIDYYEPYLWRTALYFKSNGSWSYQEEPSFNREVRQGKIGLGLFLGKWWRIQGGYKVKYTYLSDVSPDLVETIGAGRVSLFDVEVNFDSRDSKIIPGRGVYFLSNLTISEPYIFGTIGFFKAEAEYRRFFTLLKPVIMATQFKSGYIVRLEDIPIPLEEKFFLGGSSTIRGYDRNSLGPKTALGTPKGGNFYYLLRSELRIHVWKYLGSKVFYDNGGLYKFMRAAESEDCSNSLGIGLTAAAGLWTARVEYAWRIEQGLKPGAWYFEVGQAF